MFKKLISNLPFNPSLIGQLSFYAKRIHKESRIRAFGFGLLILALIIQLFAVFSPPESTLAASDNDLIRGGFTTKTQAIGDCINNYHGDYRTILAYFDISCNDVSNASTTWIKSTDYGRQLFSMGRNPYGKTGERAVQIQGVNYYMRYLWSWDSHTYSSYKALVGHNSKGATFFLLYNCGNLVIIGAPVPPPPTDVCPNIPGIQINKNQCDVCEGLAGIQTTLAQCDVCKNKPGIQTKLEDCDVCANIPGIQLSTTECKPCQNAQNNGDTNACVVPSKTAQNLTQNITNADGTTAHAGDQIIYTLISTNDGKSTALYIPQEDLTDVLEYANLVDAHGGTLDSATKIITWPSVSIPSKQSVSNQITVQVKNPIPATPQSTSNPGSFDLVMTNVYGNAINIKLPRTPGKTVEHVSKSLPNTGPGSSVLILFGLTTIVGYLFARSRLMAKELDIVKSDFSASGGL